MEKNTKKILIGSGILIAAYFFYNKYLASKSASIVPATSIGSVTKGLNFNDMADNLFNAMNGYGTNTQTIIGIFSNINNQSDMNSLVSAYGTRTLDSGFLNIFSPNYTGDLYGSLKSELSTSDLSLLNQILASKGIKIIS